MFSRRETADTMDKQLGKEKLVHFMFKKFNKKRPKAQISFQGEKLPILWTSNWEKKSLSILCSKKKKTSKDKGKNEVRNQSVH